MWINIVCIKLIQIKVLFCFNPNYCNFGFTKLEIKITFALPLIYMKCWNILDLVRLPSEIPGIQGCPIKPLKQEPGNYPWVHETNLLKSPSFNISDLMIYSKNNHLTKYHNYSVPMNTTITLNDRPCVSMVTYMRDRVFLLYIVFLW